MRAVRDAPGVLDLLADRRWLDVDNGTGTEARLFTAKVERIKATYTFNRRSFVRLIAQREARHQDSVLYGFDPVTDPPKSESTQLSALFAYKLNWQSVLFVGYGDVRERSIDPLVDGLQPAERSFFLKLSYAFQR